MRYLLSSFFLLSLSACYTFRGISIDQDVKTFFVQNFENQASNAPPTLAVDFTERLKDKIRSETRLVLSGNNPDVEFTGKVTDFRVVPVAPKPGETVAINQLHIKLRVNYLSNLDPKKGWTAERDFTYFLEFSADRDLSQVQAQLIQDIGNQLLEDIFNAAFNNW